MGIAVTAPVSGVQAHIQWNGCKFVDEAPVMVLVTQFSVYLCGYAGGRHHYKRLDVAIAKARHMVGDYDCAGCDEPIHWIAEPHRIYVHNSSKETNCPAGGVAKPAE
jgi:hypothetical protein